MDDRDWPARSSGPPDVPQRCWFCRHAVPHQGNERPWTMRFEPVPGWDAEERPYLLGRGARLATTYKIRDCPRFEEG